MSFRLLLLQNTVTGSMSELMEGAPAKLAAAAPGITVDLAATEAEAAALIGEADAAFGWLPPGLFEKAGKLRWLQCPQAGPDPSFYHPALIDSEVTVTNMRGVYSDHISAHVMAWLLSFSRGMHVYAGRQRAGVWQADVATVFLPEATALVVGLGGIGAEVARLCGQFAMTVIGTDPRTEAAPPGVSELHPPERLDGLLPRADFVVLTAPETPATRGFFNRARFAAMKDSGFFINIGRGATVVLDDLDRALRSGAIAGAALDVFQIEPLPPGHRLWSAPNMLITPHTATHGPYLPERWAEVLVENCRRFAAGEPLKNVVDKANWF